LTGQVFLKSDSVVLFLVKNLFTSSFLSKLNAAQFVNGPHIGFKLIRTGVFVQALLKQKRNMLGYRNWRETCDTINSVLKASIQITNKCFIHSPVKKKAKALIKSSAKFKIISWGNCQRDYW